MTNKNFNSDYIRGFVMLMAVGFVLIVGWIFLDNHFRSKDFPDLTFADSLKGERVSSFETNYDDYPTIVSILSIGDIVSKKANSDTIVISHSGKDYLYILGQMIEKKK